MDLDPIEFESEEEFYSEESVTMPPQKRQRTLKEWKLFEMVPTGKDGPKRCKCKGCGTIYKWQSKTGTNNMLRHLQSCSKLLEQPSGSLELSKPRDQDEFGKIVAKAIVLHDLPFQFVEWVGIKKMIEYCTNDFHTVPRNIAKVDVKKMFGEEKLRIKKMLQEAPGRISLTLNWWTSIATDDYLCVTAHFVDKEWNLNKRVLGFCLMSPPHDGISIANKVMSLLCELGIEKKLFSLTLDNVSSNKCFVDNLKGRLDICKALVCKGEFMHIRCCAHIINSVVQDWLKEIDASIDKIRESVKYVKGSQVRKQKFLECVKQVGLDSKKGLRQDVPTQWNSTYLMLDVAIYYRRAWCTLEYKHSDYVHCPSPSEWHRLEKVCKFLRYFYEITCLFSRSKYPTSNLYMPKVFLAHWISMQNLESEDEFLTKMASQMYKEMYKYWSDFCTIMAIAIILDPRYKMYFIERVFKKLYGVGSTQLKHVRTTLCFLFDEYVSSSNASTSVAKGTPSSIDGLDFIFEEMDKNHSGDAIVTPKNQLELYLEDQRLERTMDLDILSYWRGNEPLYPELASMARDVLTIPISTVASESAFSMGDRVLDQYLSSLKPDVVEATICTRDWVHGSKDSERFQLQELTEDILNLNINFADEQSIESSTQNSDSDS